MELTIGILFPISSDIICFDVGNFCSPSNKESINAIIYRK